MLAYTNFPNNNNKPVGRNSICLCYPPHHTISMLSSSALAYEISARHLNLLTFRKLVFSVISHKNLLTYARRKCPWGASVCLRAFYAIWQKIWLRIWRTIFVRYYPWNIRVFLRFSSLSWVSGSSHKFSLVNWESNIVGSIRSCVPPLKPCAAHFPQLCPGNAVRHRRTG